MFPLTRQVAHLDLQIRRDPGASPGQLMALLIVQFGMACPLLSDSAISKYRKRLGYTRKIQEIVAQERMSPRVFEYLALFVGVLGDERAAGTTTDDIAFFDAAGVNKDNGNVVRGYSLCGHPCATTQPRSWDLRSNLSVLACLDTSGIIFPCVLEGQCPPLMLFLNRYFI